MSLDRSIRITCDTKLTIPCNELHGIQGALKMMTKENFQKLRKNILKDGVTFALHVWKEQVQLDGRTGVKWWIIDGHGRHAVIKHLIAEEEYSCGGLPCVEIEAVSYHEAKKKVLHSSSLYHTMTNEGLYEFMSETGLDMESLSNFQLPEIDLPQFKMEFFADPKASDPEKDENGKHVSFDAYNSAAIKQIVLYFPKEEYEKVISAFDFLTEKLQLEDHSQVVWRLLSEASRAHQKGN